MLTLLVLPPVHVWGDLSSKKPQVLFNRRFIFIILNSIFGGLQKEGLAINVAPGVTSDSGVGGGKVRPTCVRPECVSRSENSRKAFPSSSRLVAFQLAAPWSVRSVGRRRILLGCNHLMDTPNYPFFSLQTSEARFEWLPALGALLCALK